MAEKADTQKSEFFIPYPEKYIKLYLTPEEIAILIILLRFRDCQRLNPSYNQIRDHIIIHQSRINKALRALEYAGIIEVEVRRTIEGISRNHFKLIDFDDNEGVIAAKRQRLEYKRVQIKEKYKDKRPGSLERLNAHKAKLSTYSQSIHNSPDQHLIQYRINTRSDTGSTPDLINYTDPIRSNELEVDQKGRQIVDKSPQFASGRKQAPDALSPSLLEHVSKLLQSIFKAKEVF